MGVYLLSLRRGSIAGVDRFRVVLEATRLTECLTAKLDALLSFHEQNFISDCLNISILANIVGNHVTAIYIVGKVNYIEAVLF